MIIAFLFSLFLGAVHFWNEKLFFRKEDMRAKTMSFMAGASIAYVFLYLLPDVYSGILHIQQWIFIFILFGFSSIHLLEKYLYQHAQKKELLFKLKEIHFSVFFLYYFIIGVIMTSILESSFLRGVLLFVPVVFYAAVSKISFEEVHVHLREQKIFRVLLSLAALMGAFLSSIILSQVFLYHILLAFVVGAFLYVVIMDFIPKEARGKPGYFLLGAGIYLLLIVLTWVI